MEDDWRVGDSCRQTQLTPLAVYGLVDVPR